MKTVNISYRNSLDVFGMKRTLTIRQDTETIAGCLIQVMDCYSLRMIITCHFMKLDGRVKDEYDHSGLFWHKVLLGIT